MAKPDQACVCFGEITKREFWAGPRCKIAQTRLKYPWGHVLVNEKIPSLGLFFFIMALSTRLLLCTRMLSQGQAFSGRSRDLT